MHFNWSKTFKCGCTCVQLIKAEVVNWFSGHQAQLPTICLLATSSSWCSYIYYISVKTASRFNLRRANFQIFSEGHAPWIPLARACFACWVCFAHYAKLGKWDLTYINKPPPWFISGSVPEILWPLSSFILQCFRF